MKIDRITIKKFRSIEQCSVSIGEICAIVGENNSGKSSFLRALNAFFNYESEVGHFTDGSHQYGQVTHSKIEVEFSEIPEDDDLLEYIYNDKICVEFTYNPRYESRSFKVKKAKLEAVENGIIDKLKKHITYVFIPPNRDIESYTATKKLILHELIKKFVEDATSKRDDISPHFTRLTGHIKKKSLSKIEKQLKSFYSIGHSFDFDISFDKELDYSFLLDKIGLFIEDCGQQFKIADCGSGIQSLTMIALYRYLAHLKHSNIIIGIEEPETNLHPQAQRELINSIRTEDGERKEIQTIMSTHSPTIIDKLDHTDIIFCTKRLDPKRGFKTLVKKLPDDFWTKYKLEEYKYYGFYRYRNSEFFYARVCIITESKHDAEVIKFLIESNGYDLDEHGVSIINLEGITSLTYPYHLLKHIGIPYFIILDKDFFVPYRNDKRKKSLDGRGFPLYRYEFKRNPLINELIPNEKDRKEILVRLKTNHQKCMDLLEKYKILSFRFALEVDLVASSAARNLMYGKLSIPELKRSSQEILTNYHDRIKQPDILLHTLDNIENKNYPRSYTRIKRILCDFISNHCCK